MFDKVLIASRGEIALRINRACREMGIATIAVHSTADNDAMHVRLADESVCIGPPEASKSYLNIPAIISAAEISGADAIHPGYGFLSENADFAEVVTAHNIKFIGPSFEHIRLMGDKISARKTMLDLGVPCVPGSEGAVEDLDEARKAAQAIGYPLLVKASAGGGGRGMRVAMTTDDLAEAFNTARAEAKAAFGDDTVYLEKFLTTPRHIEFQVLVDNDGTAVTFSERDCSLQRRHQKLLEETPSPALNREDSDKMAAIVRKSVSGLGYQGAGTLEFLYENGAFYFIEMNTRLQVEHPISEMITGIDIVREQIRIATGAPLPFKQEDISFRGHAIECRINAENPDTFKPSPGCIKEYHAPGGLGVRVDSGLYSGYIVPPYYDSLIAKLIVHGTTRAECVLRLKRALEEFVINGIETTMPLHRDVIAERDFIDGNYDIHWLEKFLEHRTTQ